MQPRMSTTPFGRRSLTLAHVATQALANARPTDKVVHKWILFRAICAAKLRLGASDRALSVLNALLTFHPDTTLGGDNLIVFPSNEQLSLRAHGMAPATLRRHLARLVDTGLIIRRDSPNGKRFARRGGDGEIETAYGFDLGPLVARAAEIERIAAEVEAEQRALKLVRERITICRRDIVKMIAAAIGEGVPSVRKGGGFASWLEADNAYRGIISGLPRSGSRPVLEDIAVALGELADEILIVLELHANLQNPSANESHSERHIQNSNPETPIVFEPAFQKRQGAREELKTLKVVSSTGSYPLQMILEACPDIIDYARSGISNWRDFLATAAVVRPMLGISPSAWDDACAVMGEGDAAAVLAAMLQKSDSIANAGGYLRELTRKSGAGEFSVGPMLMALIGTRKRAK
ncbi:MAG: replication initiation protein RepC [Ancylobacter novellus]|uniref:Replication initiation protein RepC n=1 Tax=Ancylobacter novellus TaxID=921 RepID=A0A2W5K4T3_ANCNO|nr:MAG: replication initiation protein RepC [Ancylobacter novellus]